MTVGDKVTFDLLVNTGANYAVVAQSYMTFTSSMLQVVDASQPGCVLTSTLTPDTTTFDAVLQNEVCNGPGPCNLRGATVDPGSIAYAGGTLGNPPANGDFRVARIAFCATSPGTATLHWQFAPPAPEERDTLVMDQNNQAVNNRTLYADYTINVLPLTTLVVGHVTWQGPPAQPNVRQQLPVTVTLCVGGSPQSFGAITEPMVLV